MSRVYILFYTQGAERSIYGVYSTLTRAIAGRSDCSDALPNNLNLTETLGPKFEIQGFELDLDY